MHLAGGGEARDVTDVYVAPNAAAFARREADCVADIVDAFSNPINPAEAQRFIDGPRPGDAWMARVFLVKADQ